MTRTPSLFVGLVLGLLTSVVAEVDRATAQVPTTTATATATASATATPSGTATPTVSATATSTASATGSPIVGPTVSTISPPKLTSGKPSATKPAPDDALTPGTSFEDFIAAEGLDEQLAKFTSGKPLDDAERRPLIISMGALKRLSSSSSDEFSQFVDKTDPFADEASRGKMWKIRGQLKSITPETLTDDEISIVYPEVDAMNADDPRRRYYRCELTRDDGRSPATIVTLRVPKALVEGTNKAKPAGDDRVGVEGLYVKHVGAKSGEGAVLVASRLAYYPKTPLGDLGVDVGLFDDVRETSSDLKYERECFYQLMAAMRRATLDQLQDAAIGDEVEAYPAFIKSLAELPADKRAGYEQLTVQNFSVPAIFNRPQVMHGRLALITGKARRAVEVRVQDADIRRRFGIDKYYEVSVYTRDSQNNPMLLNLLELPSGFPTGDKISEDVRIPAAFLTGFIYHRDATIDEREKHAPAVMQKAPLLIGKSLMRVNFLADTDKAFEMLAGGLIIAAIIVIAAGAWWWARSQRQTRELRKRLTELPAGENLNDLPLEYRKGPDFSGLDK